MIKCSKCGCDNSDYSIYCKQCSALLFSSESKPDEAVSAPSEPVAKPAEQVKTAASAATPEQAAAPYPAKADKTAELRSGGFKYIPFEKDQQGSYTMDPSKANAPRSPEIEQEMANDRKYLLIYSLIGAVIFAIIVAAVILSGILSA